MEWRSSSRVSANGFATRRSCRTAIAGSKPFRWQRPTAIVLRHRRSTRTSLSFRPSPKEKLVNPLINDFRGSNSGGKTSPKDIWSRETLVRSTISPFRGAAPAAPARGCTQRGDRVVGRWLGDSTGLRAAAGGYSATVALRDSNRLVDRAVGRPRRPGRPGSPPAPCRSTGRRLARRRRRSLPPLRSSQHAPCRHPGRAQSLHRCPRRSWPAWSPAGTKVNFEEPRSPVHTIELLRVFTDIEALENRLRKSLDKDAENLKLIHTLEARSWCAVALTLSRPNSLPRSRIQASSSSPGAAAPDVCCVGFPFQPSRSQSPPPVSPRSPRSPPRSPRGPHINVYAKAYPSPPFSPTK